MYMYVHIKASTTTMKANPGLDSYMGVGDARRNYSNKTLAAEQYFSKNIQIRDVL